MANPTTPRAFCRFREKRLSCQQHFLLLKSNPHNESTDAAGKTSTLRKSATHRWITGSAIAAILALTFILYGHTLSFPFVFDDWVYLVDNPFVDEFPALQFWREPRVFAALPSTMGLDPDLTTNIMLRPFSYFTFYVNSALGGHDPSGYRLVNILLHGANGCLVFLVLRHIMLAASAPAPKRPRSTVFIPLVSALVFVAHPLQTESVTYVIQRFTSMACFFFLLTIWLHYRAGEETGASRKILLCASLLSAVVGMLTKETVFMAPPMIVLIDWLVLGRGLKSSLRRTAPLLGTMIIVPALVLFVAWAQGDGNLTLAGAIHVSHTRGASDAHLPYLVNEFRVILMYLGMLLAPKGQTIDPDVRMLDNLFDARNVLSGLGIALLVALAWFVRRKRTTDLRAAMVFMFALWFFSVIFISSGLVPLPDLMAEHRIYTPSIGAIVVVVCLLDLLRDRLAANATWKFAVPAAAAVWIAVLGVATLNRNHVWRSRLSLWEDAVAKTPQKARPFANLGACHGEEERFDEAEKCFLRALELDPTHLPTLENLSTIHVARSRYAEAAKVCRRALASGVDSCKIRYNLGVSLVNRGRVGEGVTAIQLALERNPNFRPAYFALGQVYRHERKFDQAVLCFRRAGELGADPAKIREAVGETERMSTAANTR